MAQARTGPEAAENEEGLETHLPGQGDVLKSVGLGAVLREEVNAIKGRRRALWGSTEHTDGQSSSHLGPSSHLGQKPGDATQIAACMRDLNRMEALGLAISGGGIRSATFALGVIQALAEERMLRYVDYLSTVSGGGYIGSWLAKLIYVTKDETGPEDTASRIDTRTPALKRFASVERLLRPPVLEHDASPTGAGSDREHSSISWLRSFSNYLAPRVGMFSADVWSIGTIWARNTILNQTILVATLGFLLLIPHMFWAFSQFSQESPYTAFVSASILFTAAVLILVRGVYGIARDIDVDFRQWWAVVVSILLYLAAYFSAVAMPWLKAGTGGSLEPLRLGTFLVVALGSTLAAWAGMRNDIPQWRRFLAAAAVSFMVTIVFSCGLYLLRPVLSQSNSRLSLVLGTSAILLLFALQVVLVLGILGRQVSDLVREWWARVGAWLSIIAVAMGSLAVAAFCAQDILNAIAAWMSPQGAAFTWIATNLVGVAVGASSRSSGEQKNPSLATKAKELIVSLVPAVFAIGAILLVAYGADSLLTHAEKGEWLKSALVAVSGWLQSLAWMITGSSWTILQWDTLQNPPLLLYVLTALGLSGMSALLLSWRVDVNEFSMHNFYRNRLVRCYLGATSDNRKQKRDRLTNFSLEDDVPLTAFRQGAAPSTAASEKEYIGPLPIVNAAINLANPDAGKQERRADSFVFTPYHCGFHSEEPTLKHPEHVSAEQLAGEHAEAEASEADTQKHYLPTADYCAPLTLGHAFTVSGAAASPNMGYHTSGAVALLMTLFNVRLGWWFPNPSRPRRNSCGPRLGIVPLIYELFALADKQYKFVYVSDGGHFENLAVYELLRRRCRYIICCDAEEDGEFSFGGLGGLVRKARADFGIEIQIDPRAIARRDAKGDSEVHCAVGNIWYPESDLTGTLLYLKSSVTGDEPTDILQYRAAEKKFPHQTTGDQFFSESQFESYRRLGYHVARGAFKPIRDSKGKLPFQNGDESKRPTECLRRTFIALREAWGTAPCYDAKDFTALSLRLDTLMERLRVDDNLSFLIPEFYMQWKQVCDSSTGKGILRGGLVCVDRRTKEERKCAIGDEQRPVDLAQMVCDEGQYQSVFVFCHSLIQFMEDAYSLLELERNYQHPDAHGWMNLFRHWSWNPAFRLVYAITACTFGSRFQAFCERHMDLKVGEIEVVEVPGINDALTRAFTDSKTGDAQRELDSVLKGARFNHVERSLLQSLLRGLIAPQGLSSVGSVSGASGRFAIYAIRAVLDLKIPEGDEHSADASLRDLTIGFAVVERDLTVSADEPHAASMGTLRWIRIQDHLRRMGFGRKAVLELWSHKKVRHFVPVPRAEDIPSDACEPASLDWYEAESERQVHWVKSVVPWLASTIKTNMTKASGR